MEKESTFGLTPAQLGRLLAVSARTEESADEMVEDRTRENLLQQHLLRRLSDHPYGQRDLSFETRQSTGEIPPQPDRSVKEALLDPRCDPDVLRVIKNHNKKLSATITSGPETAVTTTIYYAAIASALVYHHDRISQYSYTNLAERFTSQAQRAWLDQELKNLFVKAAEMCRSCRRQEL
jgi:hypothetical protein